MAKCPVCGSRKAKRKCLITDTHEICSLCCGQTRQESTCSECPHYKPPESRRNYADVPAFTTHEMDMNHHLQNCARVIENAVAELDADSGLFIKDAVPIRVYELLIDKYHFGDEKLPVDNGAEEQCLLRVNEAIKRNRSLFDYETLVKVLSVLRFIAKRRTRGGREYLQVVKNFAGDIWRVQ